MRYFDFVIQIDSQIDDHYSVRVVSSPAGEGAGTLVLPAELGDLKVALPQLGRTVLNSRRAVAEGTDELRHATFGGTEPRPHTTPKKIGEELFNALFQGQVRSLYELSQGELRRESGSPAGLRIVIKHNPRDAALARFHTLPWELLCNDQTGDFLSLGLHTPITRYLDVPRPPTVPPDFPPTLRILVVVSSPAGYRELDLQREVTDLRAGWKGLRGCDVEILENPSRETVYRRLRREEFHILHYMGHGEFNAESGEGALIFESADGSPQPISGQDLATELKSFASLRLAFLNACDTARFADREGLDPLAGVAAALVMGGLPAVVAMQFPISDEAAIAFSKQFYDQVARGEPLDRAVAEGRLSIYRHEPRSIEWATPVLFQRSRGGRLFKAPPVANPVARWIRRQGAALIGVLACLGLVSWGYQQQMHLQVAAAYHDLRRSIDTRSALPDDPEVKELYDDGVHHLERWEYQEAADSFSKILEESPETALAYLQIATAKRGLGDWVGEKEAIGKARDLQRSLPAWAKKELRALKKRDEGKPGAAAEIYAELVERYPYNITYGLRLVDYRLDAGDLEGAVSAITSVTRIPWASQDPRVGIFAADVFYETGNLGEAADWAEESANQAEARVLQASALIAEARARQDLRQYNADLEPAEEALELFEELGDDFGANLAKRLVAYHYLETGELSYAQEAFTEWLADSLENEYELGAGLARSGLGEILRLKGEYRRAIIHLQEALVELEKEDRIGAADARLQIGSAHVGLGEITNANDYYTQVLNDFSEEPESKQVATARTNLAEVSYLRGDLAEALGGHELAKKLFAKLDNPRGKAYNELRIGLIEAMKGNYEVARNQFQKMEIRQGKVGDQITVADARLGLAEILRLEGFLEKAATKADQAEKTFVAQGLLESADRARLLMARIALDQGRIDEARQAIERVVPTATKAENPRVRWQFAITKARLLAAEGDVRGARELLGTVEKEAQDRELKLDELEARLTRGEIEQAAGWGEGAVDLESLAEEARQQSLGHFSKWAAEVLR